VVIPQEWVFFITGRTVEDRRCQLKSDTADGLLFLCGLEIASGVNALWKKLWGGFCWNIGGKCINFHYKKRAQLSVLSNEQRTLPEYFNTTSVLRPFFRDHLREPVREENFWTLWCKGRLTEADIQTTQLGATPARVTSAHLPHPEYFKCGKIA